MVSQHLLSRAQQSPDPHVHESHTPCSSRNEKKGAERPPFPRGFSFSFFFSVACAPKTSEPRSFVFGNGPFSRCGAADFQSRCPLPAGAELRFRERHPGTAAARPGRHRAAPGARSGGFLFPSPGCVVVKAVLGSIPFWLGEFTTHFLGFLFWWLDFSSDATTGGKPIWVLTHAHLDRLLKPRGAQGWKVNPLPFSKV